MDFSAALDNLKKGRKVRRKGESESIELHNDILQISWISKQNYNPSTTDILATDWEVIE